MREALRVNVADGSTWFDKAAFGSVVRTTAALVAADAPVAAEAPVAEAPVAAEAPAPSDRRATAKPVPGPAVPSGIPVARLVDLAERAGYRVDSLIASLGDIADHAAPR